MTRMPSGVAVDLNGNAVAPDAEDGELSPWQREQQQAESSGHGRFRVPAVDLDVPLGALSEVDGVVTPPGFASVYWVRNRGAAPSASEDGTTFVVTHSLRGGAVGPGNYLIDVDAGRSALPTGTEVIVDDQHYRVSGSHAVRKDSLAAATDVWADVPGRLVIITCLQVPAGTPSTENIVIFARHE